MCFNDVLNRFKLKFRGKSLSWINRCIIRLNDILETNTPNIWLVRGRIEFGDSDVFYIVKFLNNLGIYICTCYSNDKPYGFVRMRNICTHVGSVILWRMIKNDFC